MEWWIFFQYGLVVLCILLLFLVALVLWKIRGVFHWKGSLKGEIRRLQKESKDCSSEKKEALNIILQKSNEILYSYSLDFATNLKALPSYFKSIASCYHADSENPELEITLEGLLNCLEESSKGLELILKRPGFDRLKRINLYQINQSREWYSSVTSNPLVAWFMKHREKLQKITLFRLILLPDPFSWISYLSQKLTLLLFTKYLLLDIYLFLGKLALYGYGEQKEGLFEENKEELEAILNDLEKIADNPPKEHLDSELIELKQSLTSFSALWTSPPGWIEWKETIQKANLHIAQKHFPNSDHPLEEATLGALFENAHEWLISISQTKKWMGIGKIYQLRLSTLLLVHSWGTSVSESMIPASLKPMAKKAWDFYGWFKWPLKVYKWVKKGTPFGIATDLGWLAAKKGSRAYLLSKTYDMAIQEMEDVYGKSKE